MGTRLFLSRIKHLPILIVFDSDSSGVVDAKVIK